MKPKLSILIPTVVTRADEFSRLLKKLEPQVRQYEGDIEVLIYWNNFEIPLPRLRQEMLKAATGEYVVFIDDDDMVSNDYCEQIMPLLDGVDHIGMKLFFTSNGKRMKPVYHTIKAEGWYENNDGFYRQITAKDPIRRELALKGDYGNGNFERGISEEEAWAKDVVPHVKTEHFIDKEIYHYSQVESNSVFRRTNPEEGKFKRPELPKYFKYMEKLDA